MERKRQKKAVQKAEKKHLYNLTEANSLYIIQSGARALQFLENTVVEVISFLGLWANDVAKQAKHEIPFVDIEIRYAWIGPIPEVGARFMKQQRSRSFSRILSSLHIHMKH